MSEATTTKKRRRSSAPAAPEAAADNGGGDIRSRSFWSGTISFGLVTVPVALFPANHSRRVALRMLDEDGTPLARRWCCSKEEKFLTSDDIVRGYEVDDDKYVVITDEELEALAPRKSRDIDLRRFVARDALDPSLFEHGYFLAPASESTKAYRLLAEVMEETGRAGIATFVMREKEYLVAILAENGILSAETMRFADELRSTKAVGLPKEKALVDRAQVKKFEQAIAALGAKKLDPKELEDEQAHRLLALVERKRKSHKGLVEVPELMTETEEQAEIIDLMEVLKRSLGVQGPRAGAKPASASAKRGATKRKKTAAKSGKR